MRRIVWAVLVLSGLGDRPAVADYAEPVRAVALAPVGLDSEASGFLLRSGSDCLLVTAGHVLDGAADVRVEPENEAAIVVSTERERDKNVDVAVVRLPASFQQCPSAPTEAELARARQGDRGLILVGLKGAGSTRVPVEIVSTSPQEITIRTTSKIIPISQGMSGSALVMNGVPVAILSNVATGADGTARAIRLDYAARIFGPRVLSLTMVVVMQQGDEVARANAVMRDAVAARPTTDMGQVGAIEALARAKKGVGGLDLQGITFDGLKVDGLDAQDTNLNLASLRNATVTGSDLSRADLTLADLSGSDLTRTKFDGGRAVFIKAEKAVFAGASLRRVGWQAGKFAGASFARADLSGTSFAYADLRDADFRDATFDHLVLVGADLRGARFNQASAASIDVTAALFDAQTFPPALRKALCSTASSGDVQVQAFEQRKDTSRANGVSYEDIARYLGPLAMPRTIERFFPACPRRAGRIAAAGISGVHTYSGKPTELAVQLGRDKEPLPAEAISTRLRADVSADLIDRANRRGRIRATVEGFLADYAARFALLPTVNPYYRLREQRILAEMAQVMARPSRPAVMWLTTTDSNNLVLAKLNAGAMRDDFAAATRLTWERQLRAKAPGREAQYDSWPMLFPADATGEDLTPAVIALFARWNATRVQAIPARFAIQTMPLEKGGFQHIQPIDEDTAMEAYDAAPSAERDRLQKARNAACDRLVSIRFDPKMDAEHERLAKQLGYGGPNEFVCREFKWRSDRPSVLQRSWYRPGMTLARYRMNWLIATNAALPRVAEAPASADTGRVVVTGSIDRLLLLPPVPGKPETRILVMVVSELAAKTEARTPILAN